MTTNNNAQVNYFKGLGRCCLVVYLLTTFVFSLALGFLILRYGTSGFKYIQGPPDESSVAMKFAVFCIAWLFIGLLLILTQFPSFTRRHAVFLVVLVFLSFSYLNIIREPHKVEVGDFPSYYFAALEMSQNQPIVQQPGKFYRYPPLLATVLTPFVSLGISCTSKIFQLINYFALVLLISLLYLTLQRYSFSKELAAIAIMLAFCVNVPIIRTLIYQQVNLHVINLILLSLLFYPRYLFCSALSLCLAVHLKVYPLLLIVPFFYVKNWRWCCWFMISLTTIVLVTSTLNSFNYYIDFVHVLTNWTMDAEVTQFKETGIRNVSVDSFVYNTLRLFNIDLWKYETIIAHFLRLLISGAFLIGGWALIKRGALGNSKGDLAVILNGFVILPVLMLAISPSIWPHHFVLIVLTTLVLVSSLHNTKQFLLYGTAYVLFFLYPVNEIYPVSYLRLLALILIIFLLIDLARQEYNSEPLWFRNLKNRLN